MGFFSLDKVDKERLANVNTGEDFGHPCRFCLHQHRYE
jgi:hypothetical protein